MKLLLLLVLLTVSLFGQGTAPCSCASAPAAMTLPGSWVGAGAGYSSSNSPKFNAWGSYAKLISAAQMAYSYSSYDVIKTNKGITTSTRSGVAMVLKTYTFKNLHMFVLGLGTAGVATVSNTITGSFAGGGLGVIKFGKTNYTFEVGLREQKSVVTVRVFEMGFGRTF